MNNTTFKDLGLGDKVLQSIARLGFDTPTKIQAEIIPYILNGSDVIGQAQTGTGKTLAFAASILSLININNNGVKAIILVPTRELALQVSEEFKTISHDSNFDILAVYGGSSIETQIRSLKKGVDVVVGTPGRVMDLIERRVLKIENLNFFVLDEADEMLNMGFLDDIEWIFKKTNGDKQVLLFSATMPNQIRKLAEKYMKQDYQLIAIEEESKTATSVKQYYYVISEKTRTEALCRVIDEKDPERAIIFCQTKKDVDNLLVELTNRGYSVDAIHGDITQSMRIQRLERFKNGNYKFLIATDVAARGIHVDDITCVINYSLPQEVEGYIHRIGRTGRASHTGYAITFVTNREIRFLADVERSAKCHIQQSELPTGEMIVNNKYNKIIANIATTVENKEFEPYIKYVRDMNKEDLMKFSAALLKTVFDKEVGSDFKKDLTITETNRRGTNKNATRVFLTIGKMDNLKRGSLLDFLKLETGIDKDAFNNIEILTKFTFMDVDNNVVDEMISKVYNKKLYNRVIRVERAKGK